MYYTSSHPVVFLNPLEHEGRPYIRIWHKPNPFIVKRLKEAAWLRYSKTYKCFVMHRTEQCIERLHLHFEGTAKVDTRYLYRPKRLRPAEGLVVLSEGHPSEPLKKAPVLPVVRLQPLEHEGKPLVQ
ncbi:MAG: integrase, partial [Hymenobacteraceae bacterium]|nr:integrase [Hymenobacteraceae bacterium]